MKRRGFLENVFAQYDRIVSRHPHPPLQPPSDDNPPSMPPDEGKIAGNNAPESPGVQNDVPSPPIAQNDVGLGQLLGAGLAIKGMQGQFTQSSLRAAVPELAEPLLGEAAVAAEAAAPTIIPGLGLGVAGIAGLNYLEDHMPKEQDFTTAVQSRSMERSSRRGHFTRPTHQPRWKVDP